MRLRKSLFNRDVLMFAFIMFLFIVDECLCLSHCQQQQNKKENFLSAYIRVFVRKRRSENLDFTQVNRNVCPPSLCRSYDETTNTTFERPRGTGGTVFYQGDVILDKPLYKYIWKDQDHGRSKRATIKRRDRLWKNGVVVYRLSKKISDEAKKAVEKAIKHIENRTCIRFREKSKDKTKDKDFIRFISEPGCWSQIGRVGGAQLISLGRGCEALGTAVHEIVHALGIWHEQARSDRDKYVEILEENISDKFKSDFEIIDKEVSTSKGYPYDYNSLMHYSKWAFTKNGKKTIKVIGIGDELNMKIGQRKALSTIDMAQIRDMYKCNQKVDRKESVCLDKFKKIGTRCYKFNTEFKAQFGKASKTCNALKSHLLVIEDKREQKLINNYINRKYKTVTSWRTAGRMINGRMMWYMGLENAVHKNITGYTNYAPQHPAKYTSMLLQKNRRSNKFKWVGEWAGSASQKPLYEYPFICEKRWPARRKCVDGNYANGIDYRGDLDHTRDGRTCQKWTENYPHNHTLVEQAKEGSKMKSKEDKDGLGDHNKCRNPSELRRNRPWCYTSKKKFEWGYCDVSTCAKSIKKFKEAQKRKEEKRKNSTSRNSSRRPRRRGIQQEIKPRKNLQVLKDNSRRSSKTSNNSSSKIDSRSERKERRRRRQRNRSPNGKTNQNRPRNRRRNQGK